METAINGGGGLMNTLRKSYSLGDVSAGSHPVHRRAVRGPLQTLDENDRAPSRTQNHLQTAAPAPQMDDSDTEEFDDLFDEFGEEPGEGT